MFYPPLRLDWFQSKSNVCFFVCLFNPLKTSGAQSSTVGWFQGVMYISIFFIDLRYLFRVYSFHLFIQPSLDLDPRPWVHFKQIYLLPFPVLLSGSQPPREVCASKPPPPHKLL